MPDQILHFGHRDRSGVAEPNADIVIVELPQTGLRGHRLGIADLRHKRPPACLDRHRAIDRLDVAAIFDAGHRCDDRLEGPLRSWRQLPGNDDGLDVARIGGIADLDRRVRVPHALPPEVGLVAEAGNFGPIEAFVQIQRLATLASEAIDLGGGIIGGGDLVDFEQVQLRL